MKKRGALFICAFLLVVSAINAQTWSSVSTGITGTAANTTWALFPYDSMLFAGGWFSKAGGVNASSIAQWDGSAWSNLSTGTSGYISAFTYYNGNLYAGGEFDTIGGVVAHDIARWNGSSWGPVGAGIKDIQYGVSTLAVYKGALYAGGSFDSAGGKPITAIAKWNDTNWSTLSTGIIATAEEDGVFAMTVYKGELYFGGDFVFSGGTNIAKWDGTTLFTVGGGAVGQISALAVYNGNLYAAGMINTASATPVNDIAMWNGTSWSALDSGITGEAGWASVSALASYNGKLYVGGYFDTVNKNPINCIATWDGSTWSSVGNINSGGSIDAMCVFNNSLYIGGGFDSAGGVAAKNIAMLTTPSAVNEIDNTENVKVFPNPGNGVFNYELGIKNYESVRISVYNVLGEQVNSFSTLNSQFSIDLSVQPSGIYLYRVTDEKGQLIGSGKLIKE